MPAQSHLHRAGNARPVAPSAPATAGPPRAGVDRAHGLDRVRRFRTLVGAVPLDTGKPQRETTGIAGAPLHSVEGDLHYELRSYVHGVLVPVRLQLLEAVGLPREHFIGHALERLAQHHEASGSRIACSEVKVAQPSTPA